jgi:hypothetical protein
VAAARPLAGRRRSCARRSRRPGCRAPPARSGGSRGWIADVPAILRSALAAERRAERFARAGRRGVVLRFELLDGPGTGNDAPIRDFGATLHVRDAGRALLSALTLPSGTYNRRSCARARTASGSGRAIRSDRGSGRDRRPRAGQVAETLLRTTACAGLGTPVPRADSTASRAPRAIWALRSAVLGQASDVVAIVAGLGNRTRQRRLRAASIAFGERGLHRRPEAVLLLGSGLVEPGREDQ